MAEPAERQVTNFETDNVMSIVEGFGLDFRTLLPGGAAGRFYTDIHFDIEPHEDLEDILRELGLPVPS
jgi:hypothetical protein